jgi:hypothetical protein
VTLGDPGSCWEDSRKSEMGFSPFFRRFQVLLLIFCACCFVFKPSGPKRPASVANRKLTWTVAWTFAGLLEKLSFCYFVNFFLLYLFWRNTPVLEAIYCVKYRGAQNIKSTDWLISNRGKGQWRVLSSFQFVASTCGFKRSFSGPPQVFSFVLKSEINFSSSRSPDLLR